MIDYLLIFLGIKSWEVNFFPVRKYSIKDCPKCKQKTLKSINTLNLVDFSTPSPLQLECKMNLVENKENIPLFCLYTVYSFLILSILSFQSVYTFYKFLKVEDTKYLCSFFLHLNLPILYVWSKLYFRSNHFDKMECCKKFKLPIIILSSTCSIVISFTDISSFHNEYYWPYMYNNDTFFFIVVFIEWVYSRLLVFLIVCTFIIIINKHIKRLRKLIKDLENNEFDFEENVCLSNIINEISHIRHDIEYTIRYFNTVISTVTVIGGISLAIFLRDILPQGIKTKIVNFTNHDRYLIHPLGFYIVSNVSLIYGMYTYANTRSEVLKYIKSISFTNRFLSRISTEKVMSKSNGNLGVVTLNIMEETATTIDWMILGNMLSEKWLDFNIFGISTSDGELIKKSIALGGAVLFITSFLQNYN